MCDSVSSFNAPLLTLSLIVTEFVFTTSLYSETQPLLRDIKTEVRDISIGINHYFELVMCPQDKVRKNIIIGGGGLMFGGFVNSITYRSPLNLALQFER